MFGGFAVVTKWLLYDHLEGGKYHGKEEDYQAEAKNVPTTNAQSERDFGMLNGIIKTMPRATGLAVEGLVMCKTNKPQFWRDSLGEKDLASTMELARRSKQHQQQENKERMAAIYEIRMRKLEANKNEKTKKEAKLRAEKHRLAKQINGVGGLWLDENEAEVNVAKIEKENKKKEAIALQISSKSPWSCTSRPNHISENGQQNPI